MRNLPTTFGDPMGLVDMEYKTHYVHIGIWESQWHAGGVERKYEWHGVCTKLPCGKWKLNLTIKADFTVTFSSEWNGNHEQGHVNIAKAYFDKNKSHYEAFERVFGSQTECADYVHNRVKGPLESQWNSDLQQLQKEENAWDGVWGWLFD